MVTSDVVPFDSVGVEVVEDSQASLGLSALQEFLSVVRLGSGLGLPSSGVRPVTSSLSPSLAGARRPSEDLALMVETASGPVISLGVAGGLSEEVFGGLIGIEGDGSAALGLAVVVGLNAGEALAVVSVQPSDDETLAVPEMVGLGVGASGRLSVVGVLEGGAAASGAVAAR